MRSRLIYRPRRHTDHKGSGRKSFAWTEYRDLLIAVHQQLDGPMILIWDNLNVHKDRRMGAFIAAQDWLTVYHLPPYALDLNPVEGIWSVLRRTAQANTAFATPTTSCDGYDTACARCSTAATSSTDASPGPDSHSRHHAYTGASLRS